jgi:hypothetical protein
MPSELGIKYIADLQGNIRRLWIYPVLKPQKVKKGPLAFSCTAYCGHPLKRVHFTCLTCEIRRALKMRAKTKTGPEPVEVNTVIFFIPQKLKYTQRGRVQLEIIKKLVSLAEFFVRL